MARCARLLEAFMKRGVIVTGTFFFANDSPVWRYDLTRIIKTALASQQGLTEFPVHVSLPHEPWIQGEPRPPARLVISVMEHEWRPHTAEGEHALIDSVAKVVLDWLKSSTTEFNRLEVPSTLMMELTFEHLTFRHYTVGG